MEKSRKCPHQKQDWSFAWETFMPSLNSETYSPNSSDNILPLQLMSFLRSWFIHLANCYSSINFLHEDLFQIPLQGYIDPCFLCAPILICIFWMIYLSISRQIDISYKIHVDFELLFLCYYGATHKFLLMLRIKCSILLDS